MKRIMFGALLAGTLIYLFDPKQGNARRQRLGRQWARHKDDVLQGAETTSEFATSATKRANGAATTAAHGAGDMVGAESK